MPLPPIGPGASNAGTYDFKSSSWIRIGTLSWPLSACVDVAISWACVEPHVKARAASILAE